MNKEFPLIYSLVDGTQVEVDKLQGSEEFTFHLDKPTGQTDSFTWAPQPGVNQLPEDSGDPQQEEAIRLFVDLQKEMKL